MPPWRYSDDLFPDLRLGEGGRLVLEGFEVEAAARLGAAVALDAVFLDDAAARRRKPGLGGRRASARRATARRIAVRPQTPRHSSNAADVSSSPFLRRGGWRGRRAGAEHGGRASDDSTETIIRYKRMTFKRRVISSAGISSPLAGAGADFAGLLPRLRGGDVALPERPGAALRRPDGIDGATGVLVVEDAIAVGLLAQGPAARRPAGYINPGPARWFRRGVRRWRRGRRRPPRRSRVRRCSSGRTGCR